MEWLLPLPLGFRCPLCSGKGPGRTPLTGAALGVTGLWMTDLDNEDEAETPILGKDEGLDAALGNVLEDLELPGAFRTTGGGPVDAGRVAGP